MEQVNTKKVVVDFGNELLSIPNGENLILASFAAMYLHLKKTNVDCGEYKVLRALFRDKLGVIPQAEEDGTISYKKFERKKKKSNVNAKNNLNPSTSQNQNSLKENHQNFFKKKNNGEQVLINDILFSLPNEIGALLYILNKL